MDGWLCYSCQWQPCPGRQTDVSDQWTSHYQISRHGNINSQGIHSCYNGLDGRLHEAILWDGHQSSTVSGYIFFDDLLDLAMEEQTAHICHPLKQVQLQVLWHHCLSYLHSWLSGLWLACTSMESQKVPFTTKLDMCPICTNPKIIFAGLGKSSTSSHGHPVSSRWVFPLTICFYSSELSNAR